jgi:uncharacterized coiled-coil DUF342 family protein
MKKLTKVQKIIKIKQKICKLEDEIDWMSNEINDLNCDCEEKSEEIIKLKKKLLLCEKLEGE